MITAVDGMAGVGKTALAVHWAHQAAGRFPDGQLYVNLHGFDPLSKPVEAAAESGFAGIPWHQAERAPDDPGAQAGLYRTLLTGRRMLVVLDNARNEAQVRPLLPGSPSCTVVVTSRTRLAGLAAAEGARLLSLDVLSEAEAREMLAARLGSARVEPSLPSRRHGRRVRTASAGAGHRGRPGAAGPGSPYRTSQLNCRKGWTR